MRYEAASLDEVYSILAQLSEPLVIIDFMAGEMGYEILAAQCLGIPFHERWKGRARVAALCWNGCSLIYENVSDDQVELTSSDAVRGNLEKDVGRARRAWLGRANHKLKLASIPGIVDTLSVTDVRRKRLRRDHGVSESDLFEVPCRWLTENNYVFVPPTERMIEGDYIALYCRNVPGGEVRNTKRWQVELFKKWATDMGGSLVAVLDLWPIDLPKGVISVRPEHRDLDLICNVVHHSLLYGSPGSGAGELAALFGCNFVGLSRWPERNDEPWVGKLVTGRGFQYFGILDKPHHRIVKAIRRHLHV